MIPRIKEINNISGFKVHCLFNTGEYRIIDFEQLFKSWNLTPTDFEYPLLKQSEFEKVELRNNTLSWKNIIVVIIDENGKEQKTPYEIDPIMLYNNSKYDNEKFIENLGALLRSERLKAGLTQEQLAQRCGKSKNYISKVENNKTGIELSVFRRIVEKGFGRKLKVEIE